ncbi:unnamed protein product [Paramecium sonneborni]|uniref:Uncharacterized protein n=1 Tax=Paramecium sonneborni TaxID=65129 RepID=A0A8S1P3M8_9CILI|nr:unnamed protein product [Paramecium sonneborni]
MLKGISEKFTTNLNFNIDDDNFYVLPTKGEINFKGYAQAEELSQNDNIQQPLKFIANELVEKTINIRQSWIISKQAFNFNIPPSYFKKKILIQRNNDQHQLKKEINQYDFDPYVQFDDNQLNQIRKDGSFDVWSKNNRNKKYKWIISRWIVKGTKNIRNSFYKDMLKVEDCLTGLGDFIFNEDKFDSLWNFSIVHGLYVIYKKTILIPSVFIGYREVTGNISTKSAQIAVERERQQLLRKKNLNFSIYKYLFHTQETQSATKMRVDYIKNQLKTFEQDCWKIASLLSDIHLNPNHLHNYEFTNLQEKYNIFYDQNKDIDELTSEQLYNAQQTFFQKVNLDVPQDVIKHILDIIECYKLQRYYQDLLKNELANYENEVIEQYEKEFFFLSKQNHRTKNIKAALKKKKKNLKQQYYSQMIQELTQKNIIDRNIYVEFMENKIKYKNRVKDIKKMAKEKFKNPNITIQLTRMIAPPYPIIQEGNRFVFLKEINYLVTSKYYFWKFTSFCLLYFTLIANSYYVFYQFGIMGPYGLSALFLVEPFYCDQVINEQTGEIINDELIQTVCSTLKLVYKGMRKSRQEFENSEDSGMFGKGCLRICNLIEVYIFRFLFVGVFCTLILKPMLIIFFSISLFFVFITSFMWAGFVATIKWMICLLFHDYEVIARIEFNELDYIHFCMPLFRAILDIMIGMAEIIVCLLCLVIFPFFAILIFLYGILKYAIRSIYDCFMMTFVYCCGRVPYRSGCLAWKVGGDNIQKKIIYNYHKLTNDELQLLVAREIEKYILEEYQHRIVTTIKQPERDINTNLQPFFNNFNAKYQCDDKNSKLLLDQLSVKIAKQISLHPVLDQETKKYIKYTENELNEIKLFLKPFIIEQINLKNMHSFIWKRTGLQIGEYSALVDIIVNSIFGLEILIPKEEIIQEVQIKVEKEKGFTEQIERALNGQVNLNQPEKYILEENKEFKKCIQKKVYKQFILFSEMLDKIWMAQSTSQEWSTLNNKDLRFLLNYSLKDE